MPIDNQIEPPQAGGTSRMGNARIQYVTVTSIKHENLDPVQGNP
jgi:hypothetical protein